jgi:hypothetical protein
MFFREDFIHGGLKNRIFGRYFEKNFKTYSKNHPIGVILCGVHDAHVPRA